MPQSLAFVFVNYFCSAAIARALASIQREFPSNGSQRVQILIVNNSTEDRSLPSLADTHSPPIILLEAGENLGFGRACNLALAWLWQRTAVENSTSRPLVWLLNPDAWLAEGTGAALDDLLGPSGLGATWPILGTIVREPDGAIAFSGGGWQRRSGRIWPLVTPSRQKVQSTPWVSGCSLLVNLAHFSQLPQFNPAFFLYYEDFEFCRRYGAAGYGVAIATGITVFHATSSITGRDPSAKQSHAIHGYLLALAKQAPPWVLLYRLGRIVVSSLVQWPRQPAIARAKLVGCWRFLGRD